MLANLCGCCAVKSLKFTAVTEWQEETRRSSSLKAGVRKQHVAVRGSMFSYLPFVWKLSEA